MAGKGISINFLANVREFLRGTEQVEGALDEVADSLDGMAADGDDATEKLERSFRDLTKTATKEADQAGDAVGKKLKEGADDGSKALDQLADDGFSNAKEVAASFDGSAESIVEGFQGAAAEAFSGFGPAGAAAGLLAAAGLGLALQEITKQQEAAAELKEQLVDAYRSAAEEGRTYLDQAAVDAQVLEILFDSARREAAFADAAKLGIDPNTYIRGLAGDAESLQQAIDQATRASGDLVREIDSARGGESWSPAVQAIDTVRDRLLGVQQQHQQNQQAAEQYLEIVQEGEAEQREQIDRTRTADADRWAAAARKYGYDLPPVAVPITADTTAADRQLQTFLNKPRRLKVDIEGRLQNGQRVI